MLHQGGRRDGGREGRGITLNELYIREKRNELVVYSGILVILHHCVK